MHNLKSPSLLSIRQMPFCCLRFRSTSELPEAGSVPAIQRRIPEFRLHPCCFEYSLFLRSHSTSFIASVARTSPFWRCCKEKIFPCVFASIVRQKMPRFRPLSGRYCTAILRLNRLRIRGIIQRDQCRFSKSLFLLTGNPTAVIVPPSAALSAVPRSRPAALSARQRRHRRNARCC